MAVRNPFATRRTAVVPAPAGVPAPEVMPGTEYLEVPARRGSGAADLPEVSVQGLDPRAAGRAVVPRVRLALAPGVARPDSVSDLLALGPGEAVVRRLTFDVRPLRDVLESRGGWNVLAQLVRSPADRGVNAVFRAVVTDVPGGGPAALLEPGDLDVDVCLGSDGDDVAGRCRHELGRARLALTPLLAASERVTRLLAETLARPRDGAGRRCLQHALADLVADLPVDALLLPHRDAPRCTVPGAWGVTAERTATDDWAVPGGWSGAPGGWAVPPARSGPVAES